MLQNAILQKFPFLKVRNSGRNHEQILVSTAKILGKFSEKSILQQILLKSSGITAAAAKLLCSFTLPEALFDGFCPGRFQNLGQLLLKNIAQCNHTIAIQTAGNYRAVSQNTKMILHTVAIHLVAPIGRIGIGPGKALAPFQKEPIPNPVASGILGPGFRKFLLQAGNGGFVSAFIAAVVP